MSTQRSSRPRTTTVGLGRVSWINNTDLDFRISSARGQV